MESMNKFKVLTVIILCMFFFVVAAVYTNTKEETATKTSSKQQKPVERPQINNYAISELNSDMSTLSNRIDRIDQRLDNLSNRIYDKESEDKNSQRLRCKIYGYMTKGGVVELSSEAAIEEARKNNSELVMTCSL